jgi:hypothetical protein
VATPTLDVTAAEGTAQFLPTLGGCVGIFTNSTWWIAQVLTIMSSLPQIQPNTVPIFLTEDFFYTTE